VKLLEVQQEFIRTQHLHGVARPRQQASSTAKLHDYSFVSLRWLTHAPWLILFACLWKRLKMWYREIDFH